MARPKIDGVVEAVHYQDDGQILWVRAYLRRGPTWSDHVLLDREALIQALKSGKHFVSGRRIPRLAGTFETSSTLELREQNGQQILVTGKTESEQDLLEGVPIL